MLDEMPSSLLTEWMAYSNLEPFGWLNEEYRTGLIAATVANTVRNPKKKSQPYKPKDFMRSQKRPARKARDPQGLAERIKTAFRMFTG